MAQRQWWQRPQLRADVEGQERRVSWLELFFDLVFVVVIAELARYLAGHISWSGVIQYVLLFGPAWWAWIGGTFYNVRFETEDLSYRLFTFLLMLPVGAMAIFAYGGTDTTAAGFALAYAVARIIVVILWVRGGWHAPAFRPVSNRYAVGFSISILLFVASVFVEPPLRFGLWAIALLIDMFTPVVTLSYQARLPQLPRAKLQERFGLFVLIVLGEAIVGVVQGVAEQAHLTLLAGVRGAAGMALVFGLWWIYFDYVARRQPKGGVWWPLPWNYLHLPLLMAIAAVSAAAVNLLPLERTDVGAGVRWLLAAAVAVALITIGLIELTLRRDPGEPTGQWTSPGLKIAGGMLALAIGTWGGTLAPTLLEISLLLPLIIQMVYGAYVWFRTPAAEHAVSAAQSGPFDVLG
jgi:low temperature requirement protein LtrA